MRFSCAGGRPRPRALERPAPAEVRKVPERPSARPRSFAEFVGQLPRRRESLHCLAGREARGETLGHVLFAGPARLAETTLARASRGRRGPRPRGRGLTRGSAPAISILARIEKEASSSSTDPCPRERLRGALYTALEDGSWAWWSGSCPCTGPPRTARAFHVRRGDDAARALSEPFRARFKLRETLEPYGGGAFGDRPQAAKRLGRMSAQSGAGSGPGLSRGTPREAIRLLERARDLAQVGSWDPASCTTWTSHPVSHVVARSPASRIDARGLSGRKGQSSGFSVDEEALGPQAKRSRLGLDIDTLRDVHESVARARGLVERTERGASPTDKPEPGTDGRSPRVGIPGTAVRDTHRLRRTVRDPRQWEAMKTARESETALLVGRAAVGRDSGVSGWLAWPHLWFWWLSSPFAAERPGPPGIPPIDQTGIVSVCLAGGTFSGCGAQRWTPGAAHDFYAA